MGKIPKSADRNNSPKKAIPSTVHDFMQFRPCWRIGHFDIDGPWGLKTLLGDFVFRPSAELENLILNNGDDVLLSAAVQLTNKHFNSIDVFWDRLLNITHNNVPPCVIKEINASLTRYYFLEKIYPKLQSFENSTWDVIARATHDDGKSSNHNDSIQDLTKEAQDRLNELNYSDRSEIYSLRLENEVRIWGFRELNYLDIIWIDPKHEVYKYTKKHT